MLPLSNAFPVASGIQKILEVHYDFKTTIYPFVSLYDSSADSYPLVPSILKVEL